MATQFFSPKLKDPISLLKPQSHPHLPLKPTTSHLHQRAQTPNPPLKLLTSSLQESITALENGAEIHPKAYISLLQSCIDSDSISLGRRLHSSISSLTQPPNPFVLTKLVSMYCKCGSLDEARQVFDKMHRHNRNLFTWSAIIGGFSRQCRWDEVVALFFGMMQEGVVTADAFLITKILQACSYLQDIVTGRMLHSLAVRCGFLNSREESHVGNSILAMYAKCGELKLARRFFEKLVVKNRVSWNTVISGHCQFGENEEARRMFERMVVEGVEQGVVTWNILITGYHQSGDPEHAMELMEKMEDSGVPPDVFTWTSMVSGLVQNQKTSQAVDTFREMVLSEVQPNGMTVASVISACADLRSLKKGKEIHSCAVKIGCGNLLVGNALIDMYAKCGNLDDAQKVFDGMSEKDVFTWNSMIGGYALAGYCGRAHDLFLKMESLGVCRNVVTWNVMMSGYIQNGDGDQAMELFQKMEIDGTKRNAASWNTLISGYLQNGNADEAICLFRRMQANLVRPNSITILGILPSFANLVPASKVKEIHAAIFRHGLHSETSIINALIYVYSNSGDIGVAQTLFERLHTRDLISWNSIIAGCILHGYSVLSRDLFSQMKDRGVKPNQSTLASMIVACGLDKMLKEGMDVFSNMMEEYNIFPGLEHYTAMVELFGHSGRLREASELIDNMPMDPNLAVWNALLTAGRIHGNFKIASLAAKNLIKLEPNNTRVQRLISFVQALKGKSGEVSTTTKPKREIRTDLSHGSCWIEYRNRVHVFSNGDEPTIELDSKLKEVKLMIEGSNIPSASRYPNCDVDFEEESEEDGGIHSEKLAIAFSLINTSSSRSIKVVKSVRMCTECHTIAKLVSKLHCRVILLKDASCLHVFKDGKCSCRDYW